jgi:hypothetical protein
VRVAVLPTKSDTEAKEYAKAWDYDLLIWQHGNNARLTRLADGRTRTLEGDPGDDSLSWARIRSES